LAFDPLPAAVFTAGFGADFFVAGGAGFTLTGFALTVSGVFTAGFTADFFATGF